MRIYEKGAAICRTHMALKRPIGGCCAGFADVVLCCVLAGYRFHASNLSEFGETRPRHDAWYKVYVVKEQLSCCCQWAMCACPNYPHNIPQCSFPSSASLARGISHFTMS